MLSMESRMDSAVGDGDGSLAVFSGVSWDGILLEEWEDVEEDRLGRQ